MPYPTSFGKLAKSDRRKEWAALKTKHKKAISDKNIDFDSKLGPTLDKYQTQVAAIDKQFAQESVSEAAVEKVLTYSRPLRQIVESYRDKVKKMGDPAEKELTAFLKKLEDDCDEWEKVPDLLFKQAIVAKNSLAQLKAVREVYGLLDVFSHEIVNLRSNIPKMLACMAKIPKTANFEKFGTGAKSEKEWRKKLALDLGPIEASVKVLFAKTGDVQAILNKLLTASVKFNASSDYHAFKEAALGFAASTPLKDFVQRAKSLDQLMRIEPDPKRPKDTFTPTDLAGADSAEMRRTQLSAENAANALAQPMIDGIRKLP